jgi:hypothetical protein
VASAAAFAEEPAADAASESVDGAMEADSGEMPAEVSDAETAPADMDELEAAMTEFDEMLVADDLGVDALADEAGLETVPTEASSGLGALAWDSDGREGRIHLVVSGDTLWHISDAYLGTPWVWPSIWNDNGDIENPHLIHPGDRIWITATEMRRITAEEAERMLANQPPVPAAMDPPAAMEDAVPGMEASLPPAPARTVKVSSLETTGLISPQVYESAASVVARGEERVLLSQEDDLYIGLGESEVQPGDEFTLFRTNQKVMDPDTGALLGYHVDILGWVRVEESFPETSRALIRMSTGEVEVGDRVMPRQVFPQEIEVRPMPEGVDGKITFFPMRRVLLGFADFVYLNRGTLDGLEVGSPLEVYRPGGSAMEVTRDERVEVPDRVIATMLVVRAEDQTAVALVTRADKELHLGDRFRGEDPLQ